MLVIVGALSHIWAAGVVLFVFEHACASAFLRLRALTNPVSTHAQQAPCKLLMSSTPPLFGQCGDPPTVVDGLKIGFVIRVLIIYGCKGTNGQTV